MRRRPPSRALHALSLCPRVLVPFYPPWLGVAPCLGHQCPWACVYSCLSVLSWAPSLRDTQRMLAERVNGVSPGRLRPAPSASCWSKRIILLHRQRTCWPPPVSGYSPAGEVCAPFVSKMKRMGVLSQRAQQLSGRASCPVLGKPGTCFSPSFMSL